MMSLLTGCNGRFQAIATPGVGHLNCLEAIYGGRIFRARPENAETGRNCGFSHRRDGPGVLGCR